MTRMYRQGDVLMVEERGDPKVDPAPKDPRGLVLAEGESSGHFHAVYGKGCKLFRYRDTTSRQLLVVGRGGAEVRVDGGGIGGVARHLPIQLTPGKYSIRVQRSWTSENASRQVSD